MKCTILSIMPLSFCQTAWVSEYNKTVKPVLVLEFKYYDKIPLYLNVETCGWIVMAGLFRSTLALVCPE